MKKYKFGEIATLRNELFKPTGEDHPYIGLEHIEQRTLRLNGIGSSRDVISNKLRFYSGDILYGKLRPYFKKVFQPKFDGICSTDIYVIKNKAPIDSRWLFYLVASDKFTSIANSGSSGTRMPRADWSQLLKSEWTIPNDLYEQRELASILSSLDDKIELNLRMNKTLESIAQTIFKEWFVDFRFPGFDGELEDGIPKGWRKGKLAEIVEIKNGYAFKGTDFMEEGIPVIKIKNVKPNKILLKELSYVSHEMSIKTQRFRINHEDILITMSGNRIDGGKDTWVGKVAIFMRDGEFLLNQRVSILRLDKSRKFFKYYLAILLSSDTYQDYFIKNATSSGGQANISPDLVNNTDILIPPTAILGLYHKVIEPIFNKISANDNEIDTLSSLRDTLLPKLMTGKIRVA